MRITGNTGYFPCFAEKQWETCQKKRDRLSTLFSKRARAEKKIILEAPAYSGLIQGQLQIWTEHSQTDL